MKYLIDTNIPLLILLDQDSAQEARSFFERIPIKDCVISDFSLHSIEPSKQTPRDIEMIRIS